MRIRSRFAPSPTGDLHLGGAWTALAAWALARANGGETVLRLEDIDTPRVVAGSAARLFEDLAWLGLDWDEGPREGGPHAPYIQSQRLSTYESALRTLDEVGATYACDCSRAEIARAASAPHPGEEMVYPGTCRDAARGGEAKRPPAIRLRVPTGTTIAFEDAVHGAMVQHVDVEVGDFVLRRGDDVFAYQLAAAVDDATMKITNVVRADDLLASTPRQLLVMQMLAFEAREVPHYAHVPLVVAPDGQRLAKRVPGATIRELRARGISAEQIVGTLASALGLVSGEPRPMTPARVASILEPASAWRKEPWPLPSSWA